MVDGSRKQRQGGSIWEAAEAKWICLMGSVHLMIWMYGIPVLIDLVAGCCTAYLPSGHCC